VRFVFVFVFMFVFMPVRCSRGPPLSPRR
jgi:hypothetical protein